MGMSNSDYDVSYVNNKYKYNFKNLEKKGGSIKTTF